MGRRRRKPVALDSRKPSLAEDLENAICLLAYITKRPSNLDALADDAAAEVNLQDGNLEQSDAGLDEIEEWDDPTMVNTDEDEQQYLQKLRDKVLDRLAETLAKFKSGHGARNSPDSKHVSSAMMIVYEEEERVKILCSKNEGLDSEDDAFLHKWKVRMESIARSGVATENDESTMFGLVFKHQQSRIKFYVECLKHALQSRDLTEPHPGEQQATLVEGMIESQPLLKVRKWIDDNGCEFEIPINTTAGEERISETLVSGESFKDVDSLISNLFEMIQKIFSEKCPETQQTLLRDVMHSTFDIWAGQRSQSAMKAHLRRYFGKSRKEVQEILLRLRRIYCCVRDFVEAARKVRIFKSIQYIPVRYQALPSDNVKKSKELTSMGAAKSLGLVPQHTGWIQHLERGDTQFANLMKEKRRKYHVHAEIQVLHHYGFSLSPDEKQHVHRYIGCSRRCCLLCHLFIRALGGFGIRRTHETMIHRWELPASFLTCHAKQSFRSTTEQLLIQLKSVLQIIFNMPYPSTTKDLLAQSSDALSSAQFMLEKEAAQLENSHREIERMMMMPVVYEDGLLIIQIHTKPGFAYVMGRQFPAGKEMRLGDAEKLKDDTVRSYLGLEPVHQLPPKRISSMRLCRRCCQPSSFRCSACKTSYCSRSCQSKHWSRHVFTCFVRNRPNDVDRLKLLTRRWSFVLRERRCRSAFLVSLFSDDDICKMLGFNNCIYEFEVANLLCIYTNLVRNFRSVDIQKLIDCQKLGNLIQYWIASRDNQSFDRETDCNCVPWFLSIRSTGFNIPNFDGSYAYQVYAEVILDQCFGLAAETVPSTSYSDSEKKVLSLYSILLRDFNNIPNVYMREWFDFGFCFCSRDAQQKDLAAAYLELLKNKTSLEQIATSWKNHSLLLSMTSQGINVETFESNGIYLCAPPLDDFGIYRLMGEVKHALSGRFCSCFMPSDHFHSKHETLLSLESEGDYGFHGANAWERWQLLNFYSYIFAHPGFDARKMQNAKRDVNNPDALDEYLESLIPNFRRKIANHHFADGTFPKLRARVSFPNGRPECYCIMHNSFAPEGLDRRTY